MIVLSPKEMMTLFVHRPDVFSEQQEGGMYWPVRRPITENDIQEHIDGEKTIGLYCLNKSNTIKWACIDLDGSDLRRMDIDSQRIYALFPDFPRMREFSGRKGFHVWIFFKTPIQALYGQKLVKARLNTIGQNVHEVFPKQTELNENRKFGNLVKLPMALHQVSKNRSVIIEMEGVMELLEESQ